MIPGNSQPSNIIKPELQLVAWEITRSCNLLCAHCRASAVDGPYSDELTLEECYHVIDQILEVGNPILILTGGEPLNRKDVFSIARYGVSKGMRVVMGSNGTQVTPEIAAKMKDVSIARLGVSLDFPTAELQDKFRGKNGAFDAVKEGVANAHKAGLEIQINSTVTKLNVNYLDKLLAIALEWGAVAFHPFLLVPTGRGKGLESVELSPQEYEDTLNWIYDKQLEMGDRIFFKPTDAPHYLRIVSQRRKQNPAANVAPESRPSPTTGRRHPINAMTRGCMAGTGFCFISHTGRVQGCGYLTPEAGNVRQQSFSQIWNDSPLFNHIRDLSNLKGKCGTCEYKRICGGCRARAFETTGDYLAAEPYCIYKPQAERRSLMGAQP